MANEYMRQDNTGSNLPPKGTGTENIVREHLRDKNHVITDEDIKNVVVGFSDQVNTVGAEAEARFSDTDNENEKGFLNNTPPNPWDIKK